MNPTPLPIKKEMASVKEAPCTGRASEREGEDDPALTVPHRTHQEGASEGEMDGVASDSV
jgi:hypothetical protein